MKRRQFLSEAASKAVLLPLTLPALPSFADSFDDFLKAQQAGVEQIKNDYQAYKNRYLGAFDDYKANIEQEWSQAEISNQESWVEYSPDLQSKTVIDFAFNEIRFSYKIKDGQNNLEQIKQNTLKKDIQALLKKTERQAAQSDPINNTLMSGGNAEKLLNQPLLSEMSSLYGSMENAEEKLASAALVLEENTDKGDIVVVKIPLPKEFPFKRAEKYLTGAKQAASKWKIDPALVMAIAHTESHFNPLARSHIPAFGLMQIVPSSAGKDASKLMYGKSRLLTSDELYNPSFNLDTGSAYLNMLQTRYLKRITNPQTRLYCTIAAYNTGTGNVAKAFIGRASMQRAYPVINQLPPERVFEILKNDLPYKETRKYLVKVTDHMANYAQLV
ncbi:MAG: transglycosylase SLT domain-containing protein [Oleispira sp.]